jgi:hypothetical protein
MPTSADELAPRVRQILREVADSHRSDDRDSDDARAYRARRLSELRRLEAEERGGGFGACNQRG